MFGQSNLRLKNLDVFDDHYRPSIQISTVEMAERDDFAVSLIEQATRLIARDFNLISKHWLQASDTKQFFTVSTGKEDLHGVWSKKLTSVNNKFYSYHDQELLIPIEDESIASPFLGIVDSGHVQLVLPNVVRTKPQEQQNLLPLVGDFSPSKALVEFWIRGVEGHKILNAARLPAEHVNVNAQMQAEFAKLINSTFSILGQQRRYSRDRLRAITIGGRFLISIQNEMCEKFQIIPDETPAFLKLLCDELRSALQEGARLHGAWGHIALNNGDLEYDLADAIFAQDKGFVMSEDIE